MRKIYSYLLFTFIVSQTFSQNYTVLGNASSTGGCNCYRLTPDADNQAGAIFQNQTLNLNNSFDFSFNIFLGCNGANGADGIVFVLTSNPNGLGNAGEGMGYAGSNQPFSLAVEFDTWQNGGAGDPGYDHIGINSGGAYNHNVAGAVPALTSQGNIDNCAWHTVRFVWDVNTSTFSVYFDGVLRQQIVIPGMINTYFGGNPIVNWGWSGATGGGSNDQQVCVVSTSNWVAATNYQTCNPTVQFSDISTSSLGSVQSWAWTFGDGGTSSLQNPSHTYAGPGTYTVTLVITDISGCTNTYSHPVIINPPIAMAPTITTPLCNGAATGSISIVPSGGFGPAAGYGGYTYAWSNGTTQSSLSGAGAGNYTLTVTDGVCTSTAQYNISQPTALSATTAHTDAPCGGNGTATITGNGGVPPYTVNWAGFPATNGVPLSMPAGFWIADFHDANGCSALLQYTETITALPCGVTSTVTTTNVSCWNGTNGTATLTVTGVNGAPTITWNPGNISGTNGVPVTGLAAGTYTYNYSDAVNSFSGSVTITQPGAAMVASLSTIDMSCANTNDGQALASVNSGGNAPYSYVWNPAGANNPQQTGLSAGTVSVTVTDANSCTASAIGTITGPPTLTLNITSVDDSCFQSNTGIAMANVSGGNSPYTYFWSNISSAQNNLSLGVGNYTVTVTDNKGCTITGSATINQPTAFTHTPLVATNILCFGGTTGAISTLASGGTPAYSYTWSPSGTGNNPTGLTAGQYNVTIADGHNCTILDSLVLTQPASALTVTTSHTDVSCNGGSDGTLTINVSGGTPPYSFLGNPVPAGTTVIPNQAAGTYAGNLLDANNCSVAVSETIAEPAVLSLSEQHVNASCFGGTQGSIDITVTGGTVPYFYDWGGGVTSQDRTNITAGIYTVTATDSKSCTATISATITEPAAPIMAVAVTNATCFGANGSATANPAGGTNPYTYVWSGLGGTSGQTVVKPAGNYTVTATDASTCQQTASLIITEPAGMTVTESHTNLDCFGDADGDITLTVTGGSGPNYTYAWNPNVSTTNFAGLLTAGAYTTTVTDQSSCTATITVTLTQPAVPLTINIQSNNISCFGANDGSITIGTSGGTSPYGYTWNPNITNTNSASNLGPGNYAITVADANGCSVNPNVTLTEPSQPLSITPSQVDLTCFQSNNGSASVITNGGTAPYGFAWGPNVSTTFSATGLAAGNYGLTVTDNNSCTTSNNFIITQPTQVTTSETHVNVLCNGNATGSIDVTANGGTPGYTYTWNPNISNTNTATNIAAGLYSITVSDTNACTAVQTATVTEPPLLTLTATPTAALCFGTATGIITSTAGGGVPNYSYTASDGTNVFTSATGQFSNLIAGTYGVVVTDQNACTSTATAIITEPAALSTIIDVTPATCYHYSDGSIVITPSGGNPTYNFTLSNGDANSTGNFTGLSANSYSFTITDAGGCTLSDSAVVTEPDSVTLFVTPTPVEVKLGNTLQLNTTTNTTGSVTYNWSPNFGLSCYDCATPIFDGVYSQPYTVVLTTSAGCTGVAQFVVTVIPNYDVFIPNAFTPLNGDGVNDYWQIFGNIPGIKQLEVMVFNRIGEKVFESNDINFKWDGTYKGKDAPPGVYSYVAKFVWLNNHSDARYKGTVTLLH